MSEERINDVPIESIPEVHAFEVAKQRYNSFREANRAYFEFLEELLVAYNDTLEAAEKAVRARGVSCGSFHHYQTATKYDADAMFDTLGRERFFAMGGGTKTVESRIIDKARVETNVKSGAITAEEAKQFVKKEARYHTPDKIILP